MDSMRWAPYCQRLGVHFDGWVVALPRTLGSVCRHLTKPEEGGEGIREKLNHSWSPAVAQACGTVVKITCPFLDLAVRNRALCKC